MRKLTYDQIIKDLRFTISNVNKLIIHSNNAKISAVSGRSQVRPSSVSQSSVYFGWKAELAIDGDQETKSHTICDWDTDLRYKMKFAAVYCFSDVVIIQSFLDRNAYRMDDTKVFVVNTKTGTESLCGVLKVSDVLTIEGQTYRIPCDLKCGDEVKLTVRHDGGKYGKGACIHMKEIKAFHTGSA